MTHGHDKYEIIIIGVITVVEEITGTGSKVLMMQIDEDDRKLADLRRDSIVA